VARGCNGANADPDADGLDNLTEYTLGTDPQKATSLDEPLAQIKMDGLVQQIYFKTKLLPPICKSL